jgi:6-phosphogluconolactonase (cycloisomerase 2 family)
MYRIYDKGRVVLTSAALCVLLSACGGGGGSDGGGVAPPPPPPPPPATYTIGGTVTGLKGAGLVLRNNGGDSLSVTTAGAFTFATAVNAGAAYAVTVATQPAGQSCAVSNGSGTANAKVTNVAIACSDVTAPPPPPPNTYAIGGTVTGLTGTGLVLLNNGGNDLAVTANGTFAFSTRLASNATYNVTIGTQPSNQSCTVTNGSGTSATDVTSVVVSCTAINQPPPGSYTIGGTTTGLAGTGLVLQNNGGNDLAVTANGTFAFTTSIVQGGAYAVSVKTQPSNPAQTCAVSSASGTVAAANVTTVAVACTTNVHALNVVATGLKDQLIVRDSVSGKDVVLSDQGAKLLATVPAGQRYRIDVPVRPMNIGARIHQNCAVAAGSGVMPDAPVTVKVTCSDVRARFAYAANFADDTISVYSAESRADENIATGRLRHRTYARTGDGPVSVSAITELNLDYVYVANYNSNTLSVFQSNGGRLKALQTINTGSAPLFVTVDPWAGKFVYVANSGSDNISLYGIDVPTGALTLRGTYAAGDYPSSISFAPSGRYAYVTNQNAGTLSVYAVDVNTGVLSAVGTAVSTGATPTSVAVDAAERFVYVTSAGTHTVAAYVIEDNGALTPVGQPVATGRSPSGIAIDPQGQFAYVANADSDTVSAYHINWRTGGLTLLQETAPSAGSHPAAVTVDPSGRFLYVVNTLGQDVSIFDITQGALAGQPALVSRGRVPTQSRPRSMVFTHGLIGVVHRARNVHVAVPGLRNDIDPKLGDVHIYSCGITDSGGMGSTAGHLLALKGGSTLNARDLAVDPFGRFLYVTYAALNDMAAFGTSSGGGVAVPLGVVATGALPMALAVDPSGTYVYALNHDSATISQYRVDPAALDQGGNLLQPEDTVPALADPAAMSMDPAGNFLVVAYGTGAIQTFRIDKATGKLTSISAQVVGDGTHVPNAVTVDPTGNNVYVAEGWQKGVDGTLYTYAVNHADQSLSLVGTPLSTYDIPRQITVDPFGQRVYVTNLNASPDAVPLMSTDVAVYNADPFSGVLTRPTGVDFVVSNENLGISDLVLDPSGKFAYTARYHKDIRLGDLLFRRINPSDGVWSPVVVGDQGACRNVGGTAVAVTESFE